MCLFKPRDTKVDVGEYSRERVLHIDILSKGERFFSESVNLDNQRRRKGLIEVIRLSETAVKVCFNNQLHIPAHRFSWPLDIILRDTDGRAIASAFSVRTV